MEAKENRPDACAASGTADSIYKYFSTDAPDIQEEKGWLCLPDDCAADIVSFCSEQSIAYDNLLAYAALSYLQGIDAENPPSRDTLKFELLTLTNRCIDAYNLGKRDPNAAPGAKHKDAYPDEKQGAERYKRLSGLHFLQIAIVLRELHHAIGMEYAYTLCHELAPDSMCWVTMHVDGEGGCVHAHATIANHDARTGQVINKGDTSLYAPRVKAVNDELSRACGFQVLGADKEMSLWEQKRETFQSGSFDRRLGDRVADARDRSSTLDEFRRNLGLSGVTLKETTKTDGKTGEVTTGWSYKAVDEWGPKRRTRKRRASNLADDLTREGVEAYFEAKQRELEAPEQDAPAPEVLPDVPETAEPEEQPSADFALDVYDLDRAYVSEMASDLQKAHIHRSRDKGKSFMDERYEALVEAHNHPDEQLAKLREDVDAARREFHASKEARDTLQSPCPGLLAGMHVFAKAGCNARDPVSRMMADMTAMMLHMMIQEVLAEERRRQREEAERRVYESRKSMWDAEKRLKAAEKALSNEDEREEHLRHERMQRRVKEAERRAPVRTPSSADKGKQFGE